MTVLLRGARPLGGAPTDLLLADGIIAAAGSLGAPADVRVVDADGDGHADIDCRDRDGRSLGDDCDDSDNTIHPGATDDPGDDVDENCNGTVVCFDDADGDELDDEADDEAVAEVDDTAEEEPAPAG